MSEQQPVFPFLRHDWSTVCTLTFFLHQLLVFLGVNNFFFFLKISLLLNILTSTLSKTLPQLSISLQCLQIHQFALGSVLETALGEPSGPFWSVLIAYCPGARMSSGCSSTITKYFLCVSWVVSPVSWSPWLLGYSHFGEALPLVSFLRKGSWKVHFCSLPCLKC